MAGSSFKRTLTFTVTSALLAGGSLLAGCATEQPTANPGPTDETSGQDQGNGESPLTVEPTSGRAQPVISNPGPVLTPDQMGGGDDGGEGGTDGQPE